VEIQARLIDFKYCTCNLLAKKQPSFFATTNAKPQQSGRRQCGAQTPGHYLRTFSSDLSKSHRSLWSWLEGSGLLDTPGQLRPLLTAAYSCLPLAGLSAVSMLKWRTSGEMIESTSPAHSHICTMRDYFHEGVT